MFQFNILWDRTFWAGATHHVGRSLLVGGVPLALILALLRWCPLFLLTRAGMCCFVALVAAPVMWHLMELISFIRRVLRRKAIAHRTFGKAPREGAA